MSGFAQPARIVIADGDEKMRFALRAWLDHDPAYEVAGVAASCDQALVLARDQAPDLLLIDLLITGVEGLGALRQLQDEQPRLKVLVLTGMDERHVAPLLKQAGIDDWMQKGRSPAELSERLRGLVARDAFLKKGHVT